MSIILIQNSENNNCEGYEVNDQFGSFQLQYCNHRQPMNNLNSNPTKVYVTVA